ncbi:uncharacterized protein LOC111400360 [Olea europaea var. sylvestris]|uniref:uncharacterized protein LOC111400360 n=1 Tax=Olea europaea var. sylvestris TaxID=158386 RepID=UPI000C1D8A31|nr:uncharacterized protein LOC111400360 [Olea europaea var. sylvestris]
MRHPVDSLAWERIDQKWPCFASEPRNLRLGLSSDGFNPFGDLSSRYSCWPVILVIYNLPPWICMSKENLLLTLLIPGPKQPGNDIDVYLDPLIEDLKEMWNIGVEVYDAFTKSTFNLKAVLMWTINDLPAYGNLSGYPTKGEAACLVCGLSTCAKWLTCSRKFSYMGHGRFLAHNHPYRSKEAWFDGNKECRPSPKILTGQEVVCSIKNISNNWGKAGKKRQLKKSDSNWPWKKKSIFFELPYWETLFLRHNLDVMHIEKNVFESILGTILHVKGKSKDGLNSRKDLINMGIRKDLHPELKGNTCYLPAASYMLSKKEKELFCKRLFDLRLLDEDQELQFFDCAFFNKICQRVIDKNKLEKLEEDVEEDVVVILCMLERYFPPSFFDIMIHLTIHLGHEVRIGGPVQYHWMYPFERFMKILKGYVRNCSRPEDCIAEHYLADECMHFCSVYMKQAAEVGVRHTRNEDFENETIIDGRPISEGKSKILSPEMLRTHKEEIKNSDSRIAKNESLLQMRHMETFTSWFAEKGKQDNCNMSNTLKWLSRRPRPRYDVISHSDYVMNGHRFHTTGVSIEAQTICRSSVKDISHVVGKISYYGVIRDIILLNYRSFKVPLFHCDWANIDSGVKIEEGFTLVNLHRGQYQFERDPFILASQVKQVFYFRENDSSSWYIVLKAPARGFHELENYDEEAYTPSTLDTLRLDTIVEDESYVRHDCEGIDIEYGNCISLIFVLALF